MYSNFGFGPFSPFSSMRKSHRPNSPEDGSDVQVRLDVTFKESLFGVVKDFDIRVDDICSACNGTGTSDGKPPQPCAHCGGHGMFV